MSLWSVTQVIGSNGRMVTPSRKEAVAGISAAIVVANVIEFVCLLLTCSRSHCVLLVDL